MSVYKMYAYVQKGRMHGGSVCEDTALAGHSLLREGYMETAAGPFFLAGVADGIGGLPDGERASRETMRLLAEQDPSAMTQESLREELERINSRIVRMGEARADGQEIGCTLAALCSCPEGLFAAWAGNSRLYRIFPGGLTALTVDHNLGREQGLTEEELSGLMRSGEAAYLTVYMGMPREGFGEKVQLRRLKEGAGESFLLTTDGLHDWLEYEELLELTQRKEAPEELLPRMAARAVAAGSRDDISMVLVRREECGEA